MVMPKTLDEWAAYLWRHPPDTEMSLRTALLAFRSQQQGSPSIDDVRFLRSAVEPDCVMTPDEREHQRQSFAKGNAAIDTDEGARKTRIISPEAAAATPAEREGDAVLRQYLGDTDEIAKASELNNDEHALRELCRRALRGEKPMKTVDFFQTSCGECGAMGVPFTRGLCEPCARAEHPSAHAIALLRRVHDPNGEEWLALVAIADAARRYVDGAKMDALASGSLFGELLASLDKLAKLIPE